MKTVLRIVAHFCLLVASMVVDLLDLFVVAQIPVIGWVIKAPVLFFHFIFAGPVAAATLLELIPGVGTVPVFTIATLVYAVRYRTDSGHALTHS